MKVLSIVDRYRYKKSFFVVFMPSFGLASSPGGGVTPCPSAWTRLLVQVQTQRRGDATLFFCSFTWTGQHQIY
uniref:Uncharacterized protein n=1 Tax=Cucumis melo TaxID=3656 RepID=A0A9I9E4Q8_CUCME